MFHTTMTLSAVVYDGNGKNRHATASVQIPVEYTISEKRMSQGMARHGGRLEQDARRHALNMRQMAGHMGADVLGEQMTNAANALDDEAIAAAAAQIGEPQSQRFATVAEMAAWKAGARPTVVRVHLA